MLNINLTRQELGTGHIADTKWIIGVCSMMVAIWTAHAQNSLGNFLTGGCDDFFESPVIQIPSFAYRCVP
jgi:hypothetical protein